MEVRVAHQGQRCARLVARDLVRAGPGQERRAVHRVAGRAGRGRRRQEQGELVQEVGVGLAQVEGDRARGVIGDDPGGQIAPLRVPLAGWRAEDGLVVAGRLAEAELALEAAAEIGGPYWRAVGVPDSPAQRERVRPAAVGRAWQRNGQVRHQRVALRAGGFAERDQPVVDGGHSRAGQIEIMHRVKLRQVGTHLGQRAAAVAGCRERLRRHPYPGPGRHHPPRRASHRDHPADPVGVWVDAVQGRIELIAHPHAVAGRDDRTGPVTHADDGGHSAGRLVEPGSPSGPVSWPPTPLRG